MLEDTEPPEPPLDPHQINQSNLRKLKIHNAWHASNDGYFTIEMYAYFVL